MPTIGFLSTALYDEYLIQLMSGAQEAATQNGCNFIGLVSHGQHAFLKMASARRFDGLVFPTHYLCWNKTLPQVSEYVRSYNVPAVSIGIALEGVPSVTIDNSTGFYAQVVHLIKDHGFRKFAFFAGPTWNPEAEVRLAAFRRALADHNVPYDPSLHYFTEWGHRQAEGLIAQLLASGKKPDAIVCSNDQQACDALHALAAHGLKVPRDFAVVGFDDAAESKHASPPLTTVRQPIFELGGTAVNLLRRMLNGETVPAETRLDTVFIVRQSCGCLPVDVKQAVTNWRMERGTSRELESARAKVVSETQTLFNLPESDHTLKWANELFDAFTSNLTSDATQVFVNVLDQMARGDSEGEDRDLLVWQAMISIIRRNVLPLIPEREQILKAENLFHQGRVIVASATALSIVMKSRRAGMYLWKLMADNEQLSACDSVETFLNVFSSTLQYIGVERCYVVLSRNREFGGEGEVLFEFHKHHGKQPAESRVFNMEEVVPRDMLADPFNVIVQPIFSRTGLLGYIVIEMEAFYPQVMLDVRRQCSMSLNSVVMLREMKEQNYKLEAEIKARQEIEKELEFRAFHDALTKLPNRALFLDRLRQAQALAERKNDFIFAVLFVDLDGFKRANDSLGHEAGDEILIGAATRLRGCVRSVDTLARLGGDEFTILLHDIRSKEDAAVVAQRVLEELSRPFTIKGQTPAISASIGIALNDGNAPSDMILQNADVAMYRAKNAGKGRFAFFGDRVL